ncbi:MAG: pseudouridine synthase [Beijerinckiaceae bacterium]|nr:pseudouridine synthase [Beijerinckiaceae bacterium]
MTDRSENDKPGETPDGERIAKVMARAGLCSRRDAERWITDGRVSVNGRVLDSPAFNVTEQDQINVDNRPIAGRERTRLFMFHKPRGTVTTDHDPEGRNTIFDVLPDGLPRLVTIGRLDINTEGLLLLTNDGGLARVLELPSTGWLRRYRVRAHGDVNQAQLDALASGVVIEGIEYRGIEAKVDRVQGANVWLTMGLREGKNREIKRVLEHLGLSVNRLIRVSYGPFQLGELEEGAVDEVKTRILKDQLGEVLAAEAGVDFEAPVLDTKDREKIARRHPNEERPAPRERSERGERGARGGERPQRGPARGAPREEPEQRPKSARDLIPRNRKHVSLMRSEKAEAGAGEGRRKIERSETADRRGRTVPVERVMTGARDEGRSGGRNARRFAQERDGGERSMRRNDKDRSVSGPAAEGRGNWRKAEAGSGARPDSRGPRAEGGGRPWAPRNDATDRRERPEGGRRFERTERPGAGDRPPRKDFGDRPPRKDFGERPARKDFGDRPARAGGGDRPARRDFGDRPARKDFGDRPPRKDFGERPARAGGGDRPARRDFGDRPPRKDFGDRPPRKDFGDRPARSEGGDRPARRDFGDRPPRKDFGDRPPRKDFGDRPPRKDFGDRPPRTEGRGEGRPGKSFGAKSFGSKPGGKGPGAGGPGGGAGPVGGAGRSGGSGRSGGGKPGGRSGGKPGGRPGGSRPPR